MSRIATGLLDRVRGQSRFDLMDVLAYPLPVTVIAELPGIPAVDLPLFRRWAEGLFSLDDVSRSTLPSEELNARVAPVVHEMNSYLLQHIRLRRTRPTDDLIGRLVGAEVDGQRLHEEEIVGCCPCARRSPGSLGSPPVRSASARGESRPVHS